MFPEAGHQRVAQLRVVLRQALFLGLLPHLQHQCEQHLVVRLLPGRIGGRPLRRRLRLETLGQARELCGPLLLDGRGDVDEARLQLLVTGDVGLELLNAMLAQLALLVDVSLLPSVSPSMSGDLCVRPYERT